MDHFPNCIMIMDVKCRGAILIKQIVLNRGCMADEPMGCKLKFLHRSDESQNVTLNEVKLSQTKRSKYELNNTFIVVYNKLILVE